MVGDNNAADASCKVTLLQAEEHLQGVQQYIKDSGAPLMAFFVLLISWENTTHPNLEVTQLLHVGSKKSKLFHC